MRRVRRIATLFVLVALPCFLPADSPAVESFKAVANPDQVRVEKVEIRVSAVGPVVLLRVGNKAIPVFIDDVVAASIQGALSGTKPARPLSHDLMHAILEGLGARVSQVVVTLKGRTFYGEVTVATGVSTRVFDSRSSDAVALAIHFKAPILVSPALVESAGVDIEQPAGKSI